MHILLMEDDTELGEAIKHALEHQSYAVTWLTDGRQGLAALADGSLDLVLLDLATMEVEFRGQRVTLTRREFAVLRILMERAGRIVRRESLEGSVYGFDTIVDRNAIEVQVHWLRRKLSPEVIHTIRGIGYMIPRDPQ